MNSKKRSVSSTRRLSSSSKSLYSNKNMTRRGERLILSRNNNHLAKNHSVNNNLLSRKSNHRSLFRKNCTKSSFSTSTPNSAKPLTKLWRSTRLKSPSIRSKANMMKTRSKKIQRRIEKSVTLSSARSSWWSAFSETLTDQSTMKQSAAKSMTRTSKVIFFRVILQIRIMVSKVWTDNSKEICEYCWHQMEGIMWKLSQMIPRLRSL